jgi:hypothetical protein
MLSQKGEVKRTKPYAKQVGPKGLVGKGLLPVWQPDSLNFVGYPLYFLLIGNPFQNIKQCDYTVKSQPPSC